MNTNIEVLRELDELVEAARLLGVTQAKKLFGCHTDEDSRFERAMYESIDKRRAALLAAVDGPDTQAAEIERLRAEVERLQEIVRPKREHECLTLDHWRMRAYAIEANWSRCSHACAIEQTKREQAEARAEQLAEALRLIESAKDRGFGIDYARGVAQSALLRDQEEGR